MLEKLPPIIGRALRRFRPGMGRIAANQDSLGGSVESFGFESTGFAHDGELPARFTADGEGVSPPLSWSNVPAATVSLALLVEDADSPTPSPLVHAIVANLRPEGHLPEGAIVETAAAVIGKSSFLKARWLPPDPPRGHGRHRYAFQLFALDAKLDLQGHPGRAALLDAIRGHIVGRAVLVATYSRG